MLFGGYQQRFIAGSFSNWRTAFAAVLSIGRATRAAGSRILRCFFANIIK
jgi:hypothetical protein